MDIKSELKTLVLKPIIDAGFGAWFVGGCVRDALLGKKPHDFDVCTDATPADLHKIFSDFSNVSDNSEEFGVTMPLIKFSDGTIEEVEIATLRVDKTKGRHPEVGFTTSLKEDAMRRDFTVNALYEDIDGNIIDPTELGKIDIKQKVLRFIGDYKDRLSEDPLRYFRYVRFASSCGFVPVTLSNKEQIKFAAFVDGLDFSEVSKERQLKELTKILGGKFFIDEKVQNLMAPIWKLIGMSKVFGEMLRVKQSFKWHSEGALVKFHMDDGLTRVTTINNQYTLDLLHIAKDFEILSNGTVYDHTMKVVKNTFKCISNEDDEHKRFLMILSAYLHDIGKAHSSLGTKENTFEINGKGFFESIPKVSDHDVVGAPIAYDFCKSLGLPNDDCEFVRAMTENHMRMHQLMKMKSPTKIWQFIKKTPFDDLIILAQADETGCLKTVDDAWDGILGSLQREVTIYTNELTFGIRRRTVKIDELRELDMPKPVLTGDDLIKFGKKPGPIFKKMLQKAYEFQIDDGIYDKETLFQKVKGVTLGKND